MLINNDVLVKVTVKLILGIIGLLFLYLCIKFGMSLGKELGELIYNLKH